VKSTPARGVKQDLKPSAYKQWEGHGPPGASPKGPSLTACLLHNEPASYFLRPGEAQPASRSESESQQGEASRRK
jgi:hypothetical protein